MHSPESLGLSKGSPCFFKAAQHKGTRPRLSQAYPIVGACSGYSRLPEPLEAGYTPAASKLTYLQCHKPWLHPCHL